MKKRIKKKLINDITAKWYYADSFISDSAIQRYGWHSLVKIKKYNKYIEEDAPIWTDNWRRVHGYTELDARAKHPKKLIGSATSKDGTKITLWE